MKLAGYILAFYLILLAIIPCCAFDNCPDEKAAAATEQQHGDPASPAGRKDCGNCSPFFNCEGCATATVVVEPDSLEIISLKISPVYTSYIQTALPTVEYDFWQPPKLG